GHLVEVTGEPTHKVRLAVQSVS
ncbi:MAG: hypothetical protein RIS07_173, partial [Actinomycetota bacterium]